MTMYIALRRGHASGASRWRRLVSDFIRYRLATIWPHAGVVIDGRLYHVTGSDGMVVEPLPPGDWDLVPTPGDPAAAIELFNTLKARGGGYDYVELLGFTAMRPLLRLASKNESIAKRLALNTYCYQLALWLVTQSRPTFRVTPELLLWHVAQSKT